MKGLDNPPPYNPGYPHPENQQPEYHPQLENSQLQNAPIGYPQSENQQPEYLQPGHSQPQNTPIGYAQPVYPQPRNVQVVYSAVQASGVQTVPMYVSRQMGQRPTMMTCPSCNSAIGTRVETKSSSQAHIWALVLCILGCWPCCLIPYCMDSCQDADHYCPRCNAYIGRYNS